MGRGAVRRRDQGPGVKPGPQTQKRINRELEAIWCDADQPAYLGEPVKFHRDEEVRAYLADLLEGHPH